MTAASLSSHFGELRRRLLISAGIWLLITVACLAFAGDMYEVLLRPLANAAPDHNLIYTAPAEAFITNIKLAFCAAAFVGVPILMLQIWLFICPALEAREKKGILPMLLASPVLFSIGAAFVYFVVLPSILPFFISFENQDSAIPIIMQARVSSYLNLVLSLIFAFGAVFQLPLILILLVKSGLVKRSSLSGMRRYAIIAAFIAAAVLTPPDIISQILLASIIIGLYEVTLLFIPK